MQRDLSMSVEEIAASSALRFACIGIANVGLVPLAYRYGRRPLYLSGAALQLISSVLVAVVRSKVGYFAICALGGSGAAIAQALVPLTITDLFFTHQFASAFGLFMAAQGTGSFLGRVQGDALTRIQGVSDRLAPWLMTATLAAMTLLVLFGLEESTFVPNIDIQVDAKLHEENYFQRRVSYGSAMTWSSFDEEVDLVNFHRVPGSCNLPPAPKPLRKRFALITHTRRPIKARFYSPFVILFTFPGVAYAALTYGCIMAWLFLFVHMTDTALISPPYMFDDRMIGLFNLAPLVGHVVGALAVPPLSDWWIVRRARASRGVYEPEMRLWFALVAGVILVVGIVVFSLGISSKASAVVLLVGYTMFSFGFGICLETSLTYVTDCYHNMIGDALVGIVLIRNLVAAIVWIGILPWVSPAGERKAFIIAAATAIFVLFIPVPLILWGRQGRAVTAARYRHYSLAASPPVALDKIMGHAQSKVTASRE
ncbi:hypothetical protein ACQRIT_002911 [Beauveria bassiana]